MVKAHEGEQVKAWHNVQDGLCSQPSSDNSLFEGVIEGGVDGGGGRVTTVKESSSP
jgi:hypothetical protein